MGMLSSCIYGTLASVCAMKGIPIEPLAQRGKELAYYLTSFAQKTEICTTLVVHVEGRTCFRAEYSTYTPRKIYFTHLNMENEWYESTFCGVMPMLASLIIAVPPLQALPEDSFLLVLCWALSLRMMITDQLFLNHSALDDVIQSSEFNVGANGSHLAFPPPQPARRCAKLTIGNFYS